MSFKKGDNVVFVKDFPEELAVVVEELPGEFTDIPGVVVEVSGNLSLRLSGQTKTRVKTLESNLKKVD